MLAVSRSGTRAAASRTCRLDSVSLRRYGGKVKVDGKGQSEGQPRRRNDQTAARNKLDVPRTKPEAPKERDASPSLFEKLFPDQRVSEQESHPPEPILPPTTPVDISTPEGRSARPIKSKARVEAQRSHWSKSSQVLRHEMQKQPLQTSVLVLRNASKNLVEEDFRRLVPKGKHMDSWTLEQGDILSVVPIRNLFTLAQQGTYYLLFSSALSAFTYQGYASRIYRMVAAHTPSSLLSPLPPPPGQLIDGMDAHAVMDSFALVPPTQPLELRQLKPPYVPVVEEIVRDGGYAVLQNRQDRMPFEARLTMDGPQLNLRALRDVMWNSAKARALGWSGGENQIPQMSRWKPPSGLISPKPQEEGTAGGDGANEESRIPRDDQQLARRTHPLVYIAGFHTERALQTFIAYWHRRPLDVAGEQASANEDYESPPVANVEVLW